MPGLPFQQLPAGALTPESALNEQFSTGRQKIQRKYELQWQTVQESRRFLGPTKINQMLRQVRASGKQEMLQFNQNAQSQLAQLQRVTVMGERGLIPDAGRIKARMVFGSEVAESMFPQPKSVESLFGTLDAQAIRINKRIFQFRITEKRIPALLRRAGKFGWPIMPKEKTTSELQIFDMSLTRTEDKKEKPGDWRPAIAQEIIEYGALLREKQIVADLKMEVLGQRDIGRRVVQPGTTGGSFDDKIAESIRPRQPAKRQPRQKQSTAIELREQGTREAYEEGKRLRYWQ